jgi:hypothetical protein
MEYQMKMKLKRFVKGFIIAGTVIPETERRTGEDILRAKSQKKRHRIPATIRARFDYALIYAKTPKGLTEEPTASDIV